jgi:CRP/FNR family transcriptional regulator, cyclic AMP receptor protein
MNAMPATSATSATSAPVVEGDFSGVPLFAHLSAHHLARLIRLTTWRSYRAGAVIVRQGDTSMSFYVILAGRVQIERASEAGATVPIAELGPGSFFGEMGLIDDLPRAATVTAVAPTECALLATWDFHHELRSEPEIALALLPALNRRIRDLEAQLSRLQAGA